jgi:NhaA family Na+:H+ antiporter
VFLTAFAIIDDIGAVLVIAIFYSSSINWMLIAISIIPLAFLLFLSHKKLHSRYLFLVLGFIVWLLFLKSGIHPTVAGVLLAFTVPIRQKMNFKTYANKLMEITKSIKSGSNENSYILTKQQIEQIDSLEEISDKVQSPLQQLEHRLHTWVSYFIVPIFALSNAGVAFNSDVNLNYALIVNIAISLVVENFAGVSTLSFISLKLGLTELPKEVNFIYVLGIACLAGVRFTMSIFIANMAFIVNPIFIDSAKIGILLGALISGISGYLLLKYTSKKQLA